MDRLGQKHTQSRAARKRPATDRHCADRLLVTYVERGVSLAGMESTTTKAKALSSGGGTFNLRAGSAPAQERRVGAQAERVKAKVAGHGAVQVVGRLVPGEPHLALRLGWLRRGSRCHHMHRLRRRRHRSQLWVPLSRACSASLLEARRAALHCMAQASAKRVCLFCKLCCPLHRPVLAATAPAMPVSCRRNAQPMLPECVRHPAAAGR